MESPCPEASPSPCVPIRIRRQKRANSSSPHLKAFPCGRANVLTSYKPRASGVREDTTPVTVLGCKTRPQSRSQKPTFKTSELPPVTLILEHGRSATPVQFFCHTVLPGCVSKLRYGSGSKECASSFPHSITAITDMAAR